MNELDAIKQATHSKENECSCDRCVKMCKEVPCLGTPYDILRLAENGYIHRLSVTDWAAGIPFGMPEIEMIQIQYDGKRGCCSMLYDNGKCALHRKGLKPTEGRLANCKKKYSPGDLTLTGAVAMMWLRPDNVPVIEKIVEKMNQSYETK